MTHLGSLRSLHPRRLAIVVAAVALLVLAGHTPSAGLCGDAESPAFTLNTFTAGDHVRIVVTDAFSGLRVRNTYVKIFNSPGQDECFKEGPVPAGGAFEADLPAGTYVAWAEQREFEGYHSGWSEPFVCSGSGAYMTRFVELRTRTVVLVHGWTGNKNSWSDPQTTDWEAALQAAGYRVGIPEMPGTDGVAGTKSLPDQTDFLAQQIQSYGVESVYVVAHSFGGLVARSCSEGPLRKRVVRVFTLATPNHGTPLATGVGQAVVIAHTFVADPSLDYSYLALRYMLRFHETFDAVRDAVPNNKRLRALNQGNDESDDWKTGRCEDPPNDEVFADGDVQYCTIAATKSMPDAHWRAGALLLRAASCSTSDGLVPWASAPLWADGDDYYDAKVRNYWDTMIGDGSHHLVRTDPVGIVDNMAIRDSVISWLEAPELPPSHWIPGGGEERRSCAGRDRQETWVALPLIEGLIEGEASVVETLMVEQTDSLSVMFSWFEGSVFMQLENPQGALADTSLAIIDRDRGLILYEFTDPEPGLWKPHVTSQAGTPLQSYKVVSHVVSDMMFGVEADPQNPRPGQSLTLRATATSAGVGIAGASVTAAVLGPSDVEEELVLYDDGAHDDGALDDGVYGATYVAMSEGPYVAVADMTLAAGRGLSRDPRSRQGFLAFAAVDSLDLAVVPGSTQVVESTQFVDMPCHITTAVTNLGVATCDSVRVVVDLEGASAMLADTLFALAPGQTEPLEVQLTPAAACTHVVHVRVRPADGRADENAENDEETVDFVPVVGIPNLTFDAVNLSNPNPAPGEEITADVTVLCDGTARSTGTFVDLYYDLDVPPVVGERGDQQNYIQPLMPGESFVLHSQPFSYGSDDRFDLYFQVDPEDRCIESNETDNIYSVGVVTLIEESEMSFMGRDDGDLVVLQWVAPALDGISAFNICRGLSSAGPFARVNSEPIAACSCCEFEDASVWPGTEFWYELRGVAHGAEAVLAGPIAVRTSGVLSFGLAVARPNPASRDAWFTLDLPTDRSDVAIRVYDVSGRLVRVLLAGPKPKGRHEVRWDLAGDSGDPVAAGVYFVKASADGRIETKKMLVVR